VRVNRIIAPIDELPAVIVAGASAGGVEALGRLVHGLPADLAAPLIVVLHVDPAGTSVLPEILSRSGAIPAHAARDGQLMEGGHIYVAPPDHHLLVEGRVLRLGGGPRVSGHRPALDSTMGSVAAAFGPRAIGVVLSGNRDDGSAGLAAIKAGGGIALVQDPAECLYEGMPTNAIARVAVDEVLAVDELARRLAEICGALPTPRPRRNGDAA
jgi:two-component system chemotaxis response regulator CheB